MTVIKSENGWYNHSSFSQREGDRSREKELLRKKTRVLFDLRKKDAAFC